MYNTFEGDIFCFLALKPQNLGDLIALKSNPGKVLIFKFKVFNTSIFRANFFSTFQPAFTCSKLTKETLEQGVTYV